MATDFGSTFDGSARDIVGSDMNVQEARGRFTISPGSVTEDVHVIELHDCFSANELLIYEALGLCGDGEGPKLIPATISHLWRPMGG